MPKVFLTGLVLFLLLSAGYGLATIQAARAIPWDCTDWQAFAHADRTTAILESLAENRGKTLYCGIDQSDTFTKAETWAAGKDRNERDDTVYSGERGQFRGFIAAQEGWLTEGESGITGVSRDRIFEFPREKRRRVTRIKRLKVPESAERIVASPLGPLNTHAYSENTARLAMRQAYWSEANREAPARADAGFAEYWNGKAVAAAGAYCQSRGYSRAVRIAPGALPQDYVQQVSNTQVNAGWGYAEFTINGPTSHTGRAYQYVLWSATCEKKVRRTRN